MDDRHIEAEAGTPESTWLPWLAGAGLTTLALEDLLRAEQRLVVLAPHPDDEVLSCGALLTLHAARGGAVLIVAVTDGEASHADDPCVAPAQLAAQRRRERAEGLERLGVQGAPVRRLGLRDGAVAADDAALDRAVQALLQPADVLLTTWRLDGHPDHDACGRSAARVAERTGCRLIEAPVWMWHWARPGDARVPWQRLRALRVDAALQRRKAHALNAHVTQLEPRHAGHALLLPPVLGRDILQRNGRPAEHYFR